MEGFKSNLILAFSAIALINSATLIGTNSTHIAIILLLLYLSIYAKTFWLIVVPSLIIQQGFEKTVFYDQESSILTLHDFNSIPDLWFTLFSVRLLTSIIRNKGLAIPRPILLTFFTLSTLLGLGSLLFMFSHPPMELMNKAPIKLLLFIFLSGGIYYQFNKVNNGIYLFIGLVACSLLGVFFRIYLTLTYEVKDPGVYTFVSVYFVAYMIVYGHRSFSGLLSSRLLWILVLLLHFSVSRTEIILFTITLFLILSNVSKIRLSIGLSLALSMIAIAIYSLAPESVVNYLTHKLQFFDVDNLEAYSLGDSASVRVYTFLNLLFGETGNFLNVLFGYGVFGYINFDVHHHYAIYSEGAFNSEQIFSNKFYQLHFFLNNIIFYFGLVGVAVYFFVAFFLFKKRNNAVESIFILYFLLNLFFRQELILLFIPVLFATRINTLLYKLGYYKL